ncbi:hypothetical protein DFS34DRAFT_622257 [Phlyctochytrium arcticum]|nr:hypothetical protein DFS34DRAFT_622257 [Phlyctochytrium arcticum]
MHNHTEIYSAEPKERLPDFGSENWSVIQTSYSALFGVHVLWWIASLYLYVKRRNHPSIIHNGFLLTIVGAVTGLISSMDIGLHVILKQWPCAMTMWAINLGLSITTITTILRSSLVLYKYDISRCKPSWFTRIFVHRHLRRTRRLRSPTLDALAESNFMRGFDPVLSNFSNPDQEASLPVVQRRRNYQIAEVILNRWLAVWIVFFAAWSIVAQGLTKTNRIWPVVDLSHTSNMRCSFGWEYMPMVALVVVYIFIACPMAVYKLRDVPDSSVMRLSLCCNFVFGTIGIVSYLVWMLYLEVKWPSLLVIFPDQIWATLLNAANHCTAVVLPLIVSYLHDYRRRKISLTLKMESFQKVLHNPKLFAEFKQVATAEFNIDCTLFHEEYMALQVAVYDAYANPSSWEPSATAKTILPKHFTSSATSSPTSATEIAPWLRESKIPSPSSPSSAPSHRRNRLLSEAIELHLFPIIPKPISETSLAKMLATPRNTYIPLHLLPRFHAFYCTFLASDAPLEVNLTSACKEGIRAALSLAEPNVDGLTCALSVDVFDAAHQEVVSNMFDNTYPVFLKARERQRYRGNSTSSSADSSARKLSP